MQRIVLDAFGVPAPEPSANGVGGIALRTQIVSVVVLGDLPAELL